MTETTIITDAATAPGLASQIRIRTMDAHTEAESAPFVEDLVGGRLPIVDYVRLTAQHHAIYEAIEESFAATEDPTLLPFMIPGLLRLQALQADLVFLAGEDWEKKVPILPATVAYVDHIREVAGEWPRGLLAHHYIRYLGDLSGGQLIRRVVRRVYRFEDERGSEFYEFPGIPSAKEFKTRYRDLLDSLPWDDEEKERLIQEVALAFRFHGAVFQDLGGAVAG